MWTSVSPSVRAPTNATDEGVSSTIIGSGAEMYSCGDVVAVCGDVVAVVPYTTGVVVPSSPGTGSDAATGSVDATDSTGGTSGSVEVASTCANAGCNVRKPSTTNATTITPNPVNEMKLFFIQL